jgi:putative tricarboxylic transport membrane protein
MDNNTSPGAEIGVGVVSILVALSTIYGTLDLPPGSFEPLGSASIPQVVAGAIIVFSLWVIARAILRQRTMRDDSTPTPTTESEDDFELRNDLGVALVVLAVAYVAVMAMDWVRFSIATLVFLIASIGMLSGFPRRSLPFLIVLAVVFGFGLEYLFTNVFVIDLP